jgi:hypothetical protein
MAGEYGFRLGGFHHTWNRPRRWPAPVSLGNSTASMPRDAWTAPPRVAAVRSGSLMDWWSFNSQVWMRLINRSSHPGAVLGLTKVATPPASPDPSRTPDPPDPPAASTCHTRNARPSRREKPRAPESVPPRRPTKVPESASVLCARSSSVRNTVEPFACCLEY